MKCPLCENNDRDYTLDTMETHLKEVHHLDENDLEQFGNDFSDIVQAQIDLECREKCKRLIVVRKAIKVIRENPRHWPTPEIASKVLADNLSQKGELLGASLHRPWQTWPLTYGFYGLLDFIDTGKTQKIMAPVLRQTVGSILASE